jgi:hypothetical protein
MIEKVLDVPPSNVMIGHNPLPLCNSMDRCRMV